MHTNQTKSKTKSKTRAKLLMSPWETLAVKKNRDNLKTASLCNRRNKTNTNAQKLMKVQSELTNEYVKEQN